VYLEYALNYIGTELGNEKKNVMHKTNPKLDIGRFSKYNNVQSKIHQNTTIYSNIQQTYYCVFLFIHG
jgi:hypothetical protein